jgi:hypothetical protein
LFREKSVQCDDLAEAYLADVQKSVQCDSPADDNLADFKNGKIILFLYLLNI